MVGACLIPLLLGTVNREPVSISWYMQCLWGTQALMAATPVQFSYQTRAQSGGTPAATSLLLDETPKASCDLLGETWKSLQ